MADNSSRGILYLIPTPLGSGGDEQQVPDRVRQIVRTLDGVMAESRKSAMAFIRRVCGRDQAPPVIRMLNEHTQPAELPDLLAPVARGQRWGIVSDAGSPAVADPGADLVRMAHQQGIRVSPQAGPSAILLALMASGLNGQRFAFHGYLPKDGSARRRRLKELEADSKTHDRTEIWMETPYRNSAMIEDMLDVMSDRTILCIAADLTHPTEEILTKTVQEWRAGPRRDLKNRPAIFLIGA